MFLCELQVALGQVHMGISAPEKRCASPRVYHAQASLGQQHAPAGQAVAGSLWGPGRGRARGPCCVRIKVRK